MILNQCVGRCQSPRLVEPLRQESPPPPSDTIRSQWADEALAETAPPPAASFGALRSWSWYVVLASLDGQPQETVEAIRAALVRRLKGYGLGKVEIALLMDPPRRARPTVLRYIGLTLPVVVVQRGYTMVPRGRRGPVLGPHHLVWVARGGP